MGLFMNGIWRENCGVNQGIEFQNGVKPRKKPIILKNIYAFKSLCFEICFKGFFLEAGTCFAKNNEAKVWNL